MARADGRPSTVKLGGEKQGEAFVLNAIRRSVRQPAYKMSKSRGNVVNPDEVVKEYGADALRLYEMFMGPLEAVKPWSMDGVSGVRGFLDRAWRMIVDDRAEAVHLTRPCRTSSPRPSRTACCTRRSRRSRDDLEQMSFNTAIAADDGVHELLPEERACGRGRRWRSSCCCFRR